MQEIRFQHAQHAVQRVDVGARQPLEGFFEECGALGQGLVDHGLAGRRQAGVGEAVVLVRAQTIAYEDFITYKGEQGAKEAGKMRAEGKEYIVQDGDVMNFLFNV